MRDWRYLLCENDKSLSLKALIVDNNGQRTVRYGTVRGWRKSLLRSFLNDLNQWYEKILRLNKPSEVKCSDLNTDWDYNARVFVCIKVVQTSKNYNEALSVINSIKSMSTGEIHFWASIFLNNKKAKNAFRCLYL